MTDDPNTYQINTRPPPPKGLSKTTRGLIGLGFLIAIGAAIGHNSGDTSSTTSSPASNDLPMIGEIYYAQTDMPGCEDPDAFDRLRRLVHEDKVAADAFWQSRPDCRNVRLGTKVWVNDVSVWSSRACVRPEGKTTCLWTVYGTLTSGRSAYAKTLPQEKTPE